SRGTEGTLLAWSSFLQFCCQTNRLQSIGGCISGASTSLQAERRIGEAVNDSPLPAALVRRRTTSDLFSEDEPPSCCSRGALSGGERLTTWRLGQKFRTTPAWRVGLSYSPKEGKQLAPEQGSFR